MSLHKPPHLSQLDPADPADLPDSHWGQPELHRPPGMLDVNVRWLETIRRIEEESIRPHP
jgi:hypothetical protein